MRLEAADRLEHPNEHPLELRDGDDAPVVVADRGEVAHLSEGEQPLVLGICPSDAMEDVDVLGGGKPLEGEVGKSPQVQPVGHHRMQPAQDHILHEAPRPRTEREQVDRGHTAAAARLGNPDDDPMQGR